MYTWIPDIGKMLRSLPTAHLRGGAVGSTRKKKNYLLHCYFEDGQTFEGLLLALSGVFWFFVSCLHVCLWSTTSQRPLSLRENSIRALSTRCRCPWTQPTGHEPRRLDSSCLSYIRYGRCCSWPVRFVGGRRKPLLSQAAGVQEIKTDRLDA